MVRERAPEGLSLFPNRAVWRAPDVSVLGSGRGGGDSKQAQSGRSWLSSPHVNEVLWRVSAPRPIATPAFEGTQHGIAPWASVLDDVLIRAIVYWK